jgi:hypothetical protein
MKTLQTISRRPSPRVSLVSLVSSAVLISLLLCASALRATAQCSTDNLKAVSAFEKNSLVIDVRPDQINQFRGKSTFKNQARIVLVNMNPFLFSYTLKVDQTEIQDTGFLNFLNLLGSPVSDLIGSVSASSASKALSASSGGNLEFLINRTAGAPTLIPAKACSNADGETAKEAFGEIKNLRDALVNNILITEAEDPKKREAEQTAKKKLAKTESPDSWRTLTEKIEDAVGRYKGVSATFKEHKNVIFDSSVDAFTLCSSADKLLTGLEKEDYPEVSELKALKKEVSDFKSLVNELHSSAVDYKAEYGNCPTRIKGLNYADNIIRLADELGALGTAYETLIGSMMEETKGYDALKATIARLESPVLGEKGQPVLEGNKEKRENRTLQREYTVNSQYDISALDIVATAVPLGEDSELPIRKDLRDPRFPVVGDTQAAQRDRNAPAQSSARIINVGATASAQGVRVFAARSMSLRAQAAEADGGNGGDGGKGNETGGGAKQLKTHGIIGARRFEISGGMAFSSLDRREFQTVLGYPRNEQGEIIDPATGNPTTDRTLTKIVGVSEQSSRRFAPLGMLHYRLFSRNIFASVGFTGERDDYGVDLEYLIGPSVLYKNMFFTFGGYAGKQQKLAGDLFEGAKVDGDIPVRKDYKWGLGFAFTYKIPLKKSGE